MKERRKGLLWEMALILLTVAACLYSTGAGNIFGAKVDWSSQHSVFPEYFRQQFYRTGQFFPEFALNIGGGQNIYNFSYYPSSNRFVADFGSNFCSVDTIISQIAGPLTASTFEMVSSSCALVSHLKNG